MAASTRDERRWLRRPETRDDGCVGSNDREVTMGFLDKAKAAATELAAKADEALTNVGGAGPSTGGKQAERFFRDLGVLAYLDATARPADASERARVVDALRTIESQGGIPTFALQTAAPPPPGAAAAGYAAAPPPPGAAAAGYAAAPPPPGAAGGSAAPPPPPGAAGGSAAPPPPPPPPAWAQGAGTSTGHSPAPPPPPPAWAQEAGTSTGHSPAPPPPPPQPVHAPSDPVPAAPTPPPPPPSWASTAEQESAPGE